MSGPGLLQPLAALDHPELLAPSVHAALVLLAQSDEAVAAAVGVAPIDAELADTAAFCEAYDVSPRQSGNCVVLRGRRGGDDRPGAVVVLATSRVDVNGAARRELDVRKVSFAAREWAVEATGMEYGGITPVGLPAGWPILLDPAVAVAPRVVVGSGLRASKLVLPGAVLAALPGARVVPGIARALA